MVWLQVRVPPGPPTRYFYADTLKTTRSHILLTELTNFASIFSTIFERRKTEGGLFRAERSHVGARRSGYAGRQASERFWLTTNPPLPEPAQAAPGRALMTRASPRSDAGSPRDRSCARRFPRTSSRHTAANEARPTVSTRCVALAIPGEDPETKARFGMRQPAHRT